MLKYMDKDFTTEEIENLSKFTFPKHDFETGMNKDERYIINKIRSDYLQKLENKLNEEPC